MLVALLSICAEGERSEIAGALKPRGLLRFAGQSVAERQIDLALRLGAERIICLVDGIDSDVLDLQETARTGGARFNAVSGALSLLGQVSTSDEILVFGDGILPDASTVEKRLGKRSGVLVVPAEGAVDEGYERIDGEWAWAGVLRASGATVEGLAQLPPDSDPASALLRLSLQRGTRVIPIDGAKARRAGWLLATNERQVAEYEHEFLKRHANRSSFLQPVQILADMIAFRLARPALDRGRSAMPAFLIAGLCASGAIVSAVEPLPVLALGLLTLGSFFVDIAASLTRTLGAIRQKTPKSQFFETGMSVLFDVSFVAVAVLAANGDPPIEFGVLALILVGLMRLAAQSRGRVLSPLRDRTLLFGLIAIAAAFSLLKPAIALGSLAIVGLLLVAQRGNRLTPA